MSPWTRRRRSGEGAQLTIGESVRQQPVDEQGAQQGVNTVVAEA